MEQSRRLVKDSVTQEARLSHVRFIVVRCKARSQRVRPRPLVVGWDGIIFGDGRNAVHLGAVAGLYSGGGNPELGGNTMPDRRQLGEE
jgi:hypothetical protein